MGTGGRYRSRAVALAYIESVLSLDLFPATRRADAFVAAPLWLAAMAILAAPVFEEFVFRGLVFRGLQRSLGVAPAAVASAAIFASVHPPMLVVPAWCMGLVAAAVHHQALMARS